MKKCSYCGATYPDETVMCSIDRNPLISVLLPLPIAPDIALGPPKIPRLYLPRQIGLAAFIGSPVAACWCLSRNDRTLGNPRRAVHWLIWGCGGSYILLVLLCALPIAHRLPHYVIPLAYSWAFVGIAQWLHAKAIKQQIAAGGKPASWWWIIGVSLLFITGIFMLSLVLFYPFL